MTKVLGVYALVVDRPDRRLGPGMKESATDCRAIDEARKNAAQSGTPPAPAAPRPGVRPEFEPRKERMDVLVIDHVQMPTPN